jgi:hypothetical protein
MTGDPTFEQALSAHRERDAHGAIVPSAAWFDLSPDDRLRAHDEAAVARRLEAALDPQGLSSTARAVLARLR